MWEWLGNLFTSSPNSGGNSHSSKWKNSGAKNQVALVSSILGAPTKITDTEIVWGPGLQDKKLFEKPMCFNTIRITDSKDKCVTITMIFPYTPNTVNISKLQSINYIIITNVGAEGYNMLSVGGETFYDAIVNISYMALALKESKTQYTLVEGNKVKTVNVADVIAESYNNMKKVKNNKNRLLPIYSMMYNSLCSTGFDFTERMVNAPVQTNVPFPKLTPNTLNTPYYYTHRDSNGIDGIDPFMRVFQKY